MSAAHDLSPRFIIEGGHLLPETAEVDFVLIGPSPDLPPPPPPGRRARRRTRRTRGSLPAWAVTDHWSGWLD